MEIFVYLSMKLEKAPQISKELIHESVRLYLDNIMVIQPFIDKAQTEYLYWDRVKYLPIPRNWEKEAFWGFIKYARELAGLYKIKFDKYDFHYCPSVSITKSLHQFDSEYKNDIKDQANESDKQRYLISSIIEEAIASSQIEGASTTRKVAKQMLMEERAPRNTSERMIANNYRTIQRIKELKDEPLTEELLLEIHKLITDGTLDRREDEGNFRTNNEVQVIDSADNEVVHNPPSFEELPKLMADLYKFFNEKADSFFIHPVIKACIIHFMIGFIHPFADGNGRTARALFYWYMLKKGYRLTEYLSISSIILKQKVKYAKAFLYTETDDNDLTYFINYKMEVLESAYKSLMEYINRKVKEKKVATHFLKEGNVNERQAMILQWFDEDADRIIKVKEVQNYFVVSNQTARGDLQDLVKQGYLKEKDINQKQKIYMKA